MSQAPTIKIRPASSGTTERTAAVHWPANGRHAAANCRVSIRRLPDGTPVVEVFHADPGVKIVARPELQKAELARRRQAAVRDEQSWSSTWKQTGDV